MPQLTKVQLKKLNLLIERGDPKEQEKTPHGCSTMRSWWKLGSGRIQAARNNKAFFCSPDNPSNENSYANGAVRAEGVPILLDPSLPARASITKIPAQTKMDGRSELKKEKSVVTPWDYSPINKSGMDAPRRFGNRQGNAANALIHEKMTENRQRPDKSSLSFPYALPGMRSHSVRESALSSRQNNSLGRQ